MEEYFRCKMLLFSSILKNHSFAVLNSDIEEFSKIKEICLSKKYHIIDYGFKAEKLRLLEVFDGEVKFEFEGKKYNFFLNTKGDFQAFNVMCALGIVLTKNKLKDRGNNLYPFKKFRHYAGNCINGMLHYGLVTVFACVAISLVVFISNDLVVEVAKLKEEAAATDSDLTIPSDFLTASIMIGFLSIFVIKISTEFASRVLNSATSQLGGAFPMIVAGATTLARSSTMVAKSAAPAAWGAAAGTAAYGARGINTASTSISSKFRGGRK
jgi:hypothetical protein